MAKYVIQKGDTLTGIAKRFGLDGYDGIVKANGIKNPNRISVGTELDIPVKEDASVPTPRPRPNITKVAGRPDVRIGSLPKRKPSPSPTPARPEGPAGGMPRAKSGGGFRLSISAPKKRTLSDFSIGHAGPTPSKSSFDTRHSTAGRSGTASAQDLQAGFKRQKMRNSATGLWGFLGFIGKPTTAAKSTTAGTGSVTESDVIAAFKRRNTFATK